MAYVLIYTDKDCTGIMRNEPEKKRPSFFRVLQRPLPARWWDKYGWTQNTSLRPVKTHLKVVKNEDTS